MSADILSHLKPCPFCGAGETTIDEYRIRTDPPGPVESVRIFHTCPQQAGCRRQHIDIFGDSAASAISQWNARAGGEKA